MRTLLGTACSLALAAASLAQAPPAGGPRGAPAVAPNPLRQFIEATPNRVIVVRHAAQPSIPLAGGGALEIESIGAFEPGYEEKRLFGIRVTVRRTELPESERTFYLEPREVDPIARAIDAIEEIAASARNPTDAEFHVADGFGIGVRTVNGKVERTVRASRGALFRFVLPADGLVRVRDSLESARRGIFGS